jgi:hypothetical protein
LFGYDKISGNKSQKGLKLDKKYANSQNGEDDQLHRLLGNPVNKSTFLTAPQIQKSKICRVIL